jgi:hypothetical protein
MEAWYKREQLAQINKFADLARLLIDRGALMPKNLRKRFIDDNPLYEALQTRNLRYPFV